MNQNDTNLDNAEGDRTMPFVCFLLISGLIFLGAYYIGIGTWFLAFGGAVYIIAAIVALWLFGK